MYKVVKGRDPEQCIQEANKIANKDNKQSSTNYRSTLDNYEIIKCYEPSIQGTVKTYYMVIYLWEPRRNEQEK